MTDDERQRADVSDDEEDLYAAALDTPAPRGSEWRAPPGRMSDAGTNGRDDGVDVGAASLASSTASEGDDAPRKGRGGLIAGVLIALLLVAGGVVGYTQREAIVDLVSGEADGPSEAPPAAGETNAVTNADATKSTDRIAQVPVDGSRSSAPASPSSTAPAQGVGVAQRAVMFEESPGGGEQGLQQYVGNVVWGTETFSPGDGGAPDIGITGKITIPDRNIEITLRIRRNQDPSIPASHIVEVQFELPPDFDLGEVSNVPGMRAKAVEGAAGVPLTGISVKVAPSYFLIGLSSLQADVQRNLGMLITRNWLDIPTVFENGRRAILVLEKGLPGDQAFRQAFSAWGLPLPPQAEPGR